MARHLVSGPEEAVDLVTELISNAKKDNVLAPFVFITDNYREGNQLVNQFIGQYLASTSSGSVIGVSQITVTSMLEKICDLLDLEWSKSAYDDAAAKLLSTTLYGGSSFLQAPDLLPSTVSQIQKLISNYDWLDFAEDSLSNSVHASAATRTSKQLFSLARQIQTELADQRILSPFLATKFCLESPRIGSLPAVFQDGHYVVLSQNIPPALASLLESAIPSGQLDYVVLSETDDEVALEMGNLEIISYPDVMTEVRAGVAKAAEYLRLSGKPEEVAILYSDKQDYARHLRFALDDAGIAWIGSDPESLSSTKMAALIMDSLAIVLKSSDRKLDRKFLLRIIRSGLLRRPQEFTNNFSWMSVEKFIRETGLFNEAQNWIPQISKIAESQTELEAELGEALEAQADESFINDLRRKLNAARSARGLMSLISLYSDFIEELSVFGDKLCERDLCEALSNLVLKLVGSSEIRKLADSEKTCFEKLELVSLQADDTNLGSSQSAVASVYSKLQGVFDAGNSYRKGVGVFVGEIGQHPLRKINYQVILGASEGALPKRRQEDPLLPDVLKEALGITYQSMLPVVSELAKNDIRDFLAVLNSAQNATISFSRSGLIGTGSGNLSSVVKHLVAQSISVKSFEEAVDEKSSAALASDIARKTRLALATGESLDRDEYPGLDSMVALSSNEFGSFTGKLGPGIQTFNFKNSLSASAVETYLKCPHVFFVTRILGFKFEDDDDEIGNMRAMDFGTMVHQSLELLHEHCIEKNMLPGFGEPFSAEAIDAFQDIFNKQCDLVIEKGQAGWLPLFEQKRRNFLQLTEVYFALEHEFRSQAPKARSGNPDVPLRRELMLRPHLAEYSFDSRGESPLKIPVTASSGNVVTLTFKGQMDRVDKSLTDIHAGVIDFKTGKARNLVYSKNELVQDLLYSYAIRENKVDFANTNFVSFVYITLNKPDDSKIVRLREYDPQFYKDEVNGGYSDQELREKLKEANELQDEELMRLLQRLVDANEEGFFPPFAESRTAGFCEVCSKSLGITRAKAIYKKVPK